jgi:hypothetical protein
MLQMNSKLLFTIFVALFHVLASSYAEEKEAEPEEIPVDLHIGAEWLPLSPSVDKPDSDAYILTRSALRIWRAIDPETEKPYDNSKVVFDCNLADLRRIFRLEKREFLLGEPLLVEFRIALDGPGEWHERIGGNYRARGRDDNFLFIMRHEDGTWVRDPYAPINFYMGGIVSSYEVRQNKPLSYWFPVQRWCAIDRPGTYDLYCFQMAHGHEVLGRRQALIAGMPDYLKRDHYLNADSILIDSKTGKCSERYSITSTQRRHKWEASPLIDEIPPDVVARRVQNAMDFAHFRIVIRQGSEEERQQMIKYWTNIAESEAERSMPRTRSAAAIRAIQFAQQDDFLPLIEEWIAAKTRRVAFSGLAMRPSSKVTTILLRLGEPNAVSAMRFLRPDQIPDLIPQLIEWLTHEDNEMRARSEERLRKWADQDFYHTWRGYHIERPTLEEGRRMQPMWEEWWEKNKDDFKPKTRYNK